MEWNDTIELFLKEIQKEIKTYYWINQKKLSRKIIINNIFKYILYTIPPTSSIITFIETFIHDTYDTNWIIYVTGTMSILSSIIFGFQQKNNFQSTIEQLKKNIFDFQNLENKIQQQLFIQDKSKRINADIFIHHIQETMNKYINDNPLIINNETNSSNQQTILTLEEQCTISGINISKNLPICDLICELNNIHDLTKKLENKIKK